MDAWGSYRLARYVIDVDLIGSYLHEEHAITFHLNFSDEFHSQYHIHSITVLPLFDE
jgi:hypothetical protein